MPENSNTEQYHNACKRVLGDVICYLWKHKIEYNDNGCDVCGRCGRHEYYDNDFHNGKPFFKLYFWFRHKIPFGKILVQNKVF